MNSLIHIINNYHLFPYYYLIATVPIDIATKIMHLLRLSECVL